MADLAQLSDRLRQGLSTPGRQAAAYAVLGVLGLAFALLGIYFLLGGGGDSGARPAAPSAEMATPTPSATATPTRTPTRTPTPTLTPAPTSTPTPTPTPTPQREVLSGGASGPAPTPAPTATPTVPAVVAGGPYCKATSGPLAGPPVRVFGTLMIGGVPVPAGTNVSLAFDGVYGPAEFTTDAGAYAIDFQAGGTECANRAGAAISVVVNGRFFPTGYKVGDGAAGFIRFDIDAP